MVAWWRFCLGLIHSHAEETHVCATMDRQPSLNSTVKSQALARTGEHRGGEFWPADLQAGDLERDSLRLAGLQNAERRWMVLRCPRP
ncbi:hypothetical protein BJX68DRAFT_149516 [Aspergillus pseudodeflectus]|uniref:Secreted protein n=1 Tax=Aspergillus pseudodeflectus TaxID=176178 RepID=A0ABR4JX70_9EURO